MVDVLKVASEVINRSTQRVEVASHNIANVNTPGFKRQVYFSNLVTGAKTSDYNLVKASLPSDLSQGKLVSTGATYDLALLGEGFFTVRSDEGALAYTRQGRFQRDRDGRLVAAHGMILQADGGGDLLLRSEDVKVLEDGMVLDGGAPAARLGIVVFEEGAEPQRTESGGFVLEEAKVSTAARPMVRQGAYEASNVSTGDEMISVMEALRRAEVGQRLAGVYDDLMGRALQAFGQV